MSSEGKRSRNQKRREKKYEHNEELRRKYPPFRSSSNNSIIHLHYLTPIWIVEELIEKAKRTRRYSIDTESQIIDGQAYGAVIQIQLIHGREYSTVVITETFHLPNKNSPLFLKIKELYSIIFESGNEIITWGPNDDEFKNFKDYKLIMSGNQFEPINLQDEFQDWHNEQAKKKTHPLGERRETTTWYYVIPGGNETRQSERTICDCGHLSHYDPSARWSLQDALSSSTNQFLDKKETIDKWSCGLDLDLGTWRRRTFTKYGYDQAEEKRKRSSLVNYAVNDCLALTELFFIMYPSGRTIHRDETTMSRSTTRRITRMMELYDDDELSDISDDEIEVSRLKVQPQQERPAPAPAPAPEPQPEPHVQQQPRENDEQQRKQKAEKQRRKNEKLRWKRRNRADFQIKIRRPIYEGYDYHKIRSQLKSDGIYTSHQLTINKDRMEVTIGLKSNEAREKAREKIAINYFSLEEYRRRWGRTRK